MYKIIYSTGGRAVRKGRRSPKTFFPTHPRNIALRRGDVKSAKSCTGPFAISAGISLSFSVPRCHGVVEESLYEKGEKRKMVRKRFCRDVGATTKISAFSPKREQLLRKRASLAAHFPSGPFENGSISGYQAFKGEFLKGHVGRQQKAAIHGRSEERQASPRGCRQRLCSGAWSCGARAHGCLRPPGISRRLPAFKRLVSGFYFSVSKQRASLREDALAGSVTPSKEKGDACVLGKREWKELESGESEIPCRDSQQPLATPAGPLGCSADGCARPSGLKPKDGLFPHPSAFGVEYGEIYVHKYSRQPAPPKAVGPGSLDPVVLSLSAEHSPLMDDDLRRSAVGARAPTRSTPALLQGAAAGPGLAMSPGSGDSRWPSLCPLPTRGPQGGKEEVKRAQKDRGRQHPRGASAGTAAKGAQQPEAQKAPRPGACQPFESFSALQTASTTEAEAARQATKLSISVSPLAFRRAAPASGQLLQENKVPKMPAAPFSRAVAQAGRQAGQQPEASRQNSTATLRNAGSSDQWIHNSRPSRYGVSLMRLMGADCMYKEDNRSLRRAMSPLGNLSLQMGKTRRFVVVSLDARILREQQRAVEAAGSPCNGRKCAICLLERAATARCELLQRRCCSPERVACIFPRVKTLTKSSNSLMDRVLEVDKAQTSGRAHGCGRTPCRQFLQACERVCVGFILLTCVAPQLTSLAPVALVAELKAAQWKHRDRMRDAEQPRWSLARGPGGVDGFRQNPSQQRVKDLFPLRPMAKLQWTRARDLHPLQDGVTKLMDILQNRAPRQKKQQIKTLN
ncbi:hypothetical protein Anapl_10646 [Anas platyrhynchos]|uniref:Uncharacterized protein n=1 Tax=Anas platyrhynchos TaxID=8839 RepID=R0LRQ6_ANAPL|nr:hypothetical protein Anapl_10646 [Anas platyrhynchos]